ncbi:hypothetical protein SAMN05444278_11212 [Psychroflexus salarius]|uniref:WD40-like Beta Propeller Repeat n=1 Tax=Psychroflexus salarius TaxID=1155689 RepID=A0A1M4Y2L4_9FLAO|nr:hypothetical protein [Psychroflexus salarius]SHE99928.1 hypothetical protein SAMN05444278_11212 [Psychroflexus salarius]
MKKTILLILLIILNTSLCAQEEVNRLLDSLKIIPTTISFHPEGDILISTSWSREKPQYLMVITKPEGKINIDTLSSQRPNRSVFFKDGAYLVHNYRDEVSGKFYTAKRKYNSPDDIGAPVLISEALFVDNMYYYFMDDNQDFYYYTYVRENRAEGGLLYSKFENGRYQKPQMIHPDRKNAVAYSPLLLNDKTMIFAQHGVKDDTNQGIHFSIKNDEGQWSAPEVLEEIPMSNVITYYNENEISFLVAKTARLKLYQKKYIMEMIKEK